MIVHTITNITIMFPFFDVALHEKEVCLINQALRLQIAELSFPFPFPLRPFNVLRVSSGQFICLLPFPSKCSASASFPPP